MYLICIEIDFFKNFTAISISCFNVENSLPNHVCSYKYVNILVKMQELEDNNNNKCFILPHLNTKLHKNHKSNAFPSDGWIDPMRDFELPSRFFWDFLGGLWEGRIMKKE